MWFNPAWFEEQRELADEIWKTARMLSSVTRYKLYPHKLAKRLAEEAREQISTIPSATGLKGILYDHLRFSLEALVLEIEAKEMRTLSLETLLRMNAFLDRWEYYEELVYKAMEKIDINELAEKCLEFDTKYFLSLRSTESDKEKAKKF